MKNKAVDRKLDRAIELVKEHLYDTGAPIPKEYEGAISSLGPLVIQVGPLPACALYLKSGGSSDIDKVRLIAILFELINNDSRTGKIPGFPGIEGKLDKELKDIHKVKLEEAIVLHKKGESWFKHELLTAIMALKLAMRAFPFGKEKKQAYAEQ